MYHLRAILLPALMLLLAPASLLACPFCNPGQTMTTEVDRASFVVFGSLTDPKLDPLTGNGETTLQIEEVVKGHPFLKGKKNLVIPRYIPVDKESKIKFLIFCDLLPQDRIDPVRGSPAKSKDIVDYLRGALKVQDKEIADRLAFFFKYLGHTDVEISTDAYNEFAKADYKEVVKFVEKADQARMAAQLVQWLKDKDTPTYRFGLYGLLLGLCGTDKDAGVLTELLNDPERGLVSGIDGVLAGYVSLKPKEGWQYVYGILSDPKKEFIRRYAALRAVRFFWEYRPDLVGREQLVDALLQLLEHKDIADLAIDDLRKWKQWQVADKVLALKDRESHNVPIVRRAILRYALSCPPENKAAAAFVAEERQRDPERVKDAEELLKAETAAAAVRNGPAAVK